MTERTDAEVLAAMKERLMYHPEEGELRRRDGWNGVKHGDRLGSRDSSGKMQATFLEKRYMLSHLIWLWETGSLPTGPICFLNGELGDNRFCNLVTKRELSQQRFLVNARAKFGYAHDYGETEYVQAKQKVTIWCSKHGSFTRIPEDYLKSAKGCPTCCREHSVDASRASPEQKAATVARRRITRTKNQLAWQKSHRAEYNAKMRRQYHRNKGDPKLRATRACRLLLTRVITQTNGMRRQTSEAVQGYSFEAFKQHIEAQFEPWMTWDNHGQWHVDHITPVSWYVRQGIIDPAVINRLENLRPLSAEDNMRKGDKII